MLLEENKLTLLEGEVSDLKREIKRMSSRLDHVSTNISLIAERLSRPRLFPLILTAIAIISLIIMFVV